VKRAELRIQLRSLGREVARLRDERMEARVEPAAREAFEELWDRRRMRNAWARRPSRVVFGAGAATAAIAAAALLWVRGEHRATQPESLSFTVQDAPGELGAWITPNTEVPLRFSDGTRVALAADSVARVTALHHAGAEIALPEGRVYASVVHTSDSRWTVDVGPFVVHVTGTQFEAGWNSKARLFTLKLNEGSVLVTGCATAPQQVVAGSSLQLRCDEDGVARDGGPLDPEGPSAGEQNAGKPEDGIADLTQESSSELAPDASGVVRSAPSAAPVAAKPSWRELASRGQNAEALAASIADFNEECARANAADLMSLADLARLAGDGARARTAMNAMRTRFPGTAGATRAAFLLGRLAFEAGSLSEASRWFRTAYTEEPNGPLAREADGRLIESSDRAGDEESARAAARTYLQRYPSGPHAPLAVRVLEAQ
jgi:TolA-binding protein